MIIISHQYYQETTHFAWPHHVCCTAVIWFKVHSYYTAIALFCRYINYFLPQVTAASPHFKLRWIWNCNAVTSQLLCSRLQYGNATQLQWSMNGPLLSYSVAESQTRSEVNLRSTPKRHSLIESSRQPVKCQYVLKILSYFNLILNTVFCIWNIFKSEKRMQYYIKTYIKDMFVMWVVRVYRI